MWLSAKQYISKAEDDDQEPDPAQAERQMQQNIQTQFDNEFVLVYHNAMTFQRGLRDGSLH